MKGYYLGGKDIEVYLSLDEFGDLDNTGKVIAGKLKNDDRDSEEVGVSVTYENFDGSRPSIEVKFSNHGCRIRFNPKSREQIKRNGAWGSVYDSGQVLLSINEPPSQ